MKSIRIIEDGQRASGEESPGGDARPGREPTDAVTAGASVAQARVEADQQSGDDTADAGDFVVEPEHSRGGRPDQNSADKRGDRGEVMHVVWAPRDEA